MTSHTISSNALISELWNVQHDHSGSPANATPNANEEDQVRSRIQMRSVSMPSWGGRGGGGLYQSAQALSLFSTGFVLCDDLFFHCLIRDRQCHHAHPLELVSCTLVLALPLLLIGQTRHYLRPQQMTNLHVLQATLQEHQRKLQGKALQRSVRSQFNLSSAAVHTLSQQSMTQASQTLSFFLRHAGMPIISQRQPMDILGCQKMTSRPSSSSWKWTCIQGAFCSS